MHLLHAPRLNKCGAISPRYDIAAKDIEAWVGRLLPSRQFGHIILTTSQGIMDHEEARCVHLPCLGGIWAGMGGWLGVHVRLWNSRWWIDGCTLASLLTHPLLLSTAFCLSACRRKKVGGKVLGFFY